ncbi:MAG TPA: PEP-CTERM sorting domain-containing protein [Verrucomicrobiae bacterium]|nr:PEP-CTERM sorting domain-containing protein [Verrucomicrobiae bacterium]
MGKRNCDDRCKRAAAHFGMAALTAAVMALPAGAQTTNDWLPTGSTASGYWTNTANWSPGVPNSDTDAARFASDYTANFAVTQDVSVTVNGIIYNDTGGGTDSILDIRPLGGATLTFGGTSPFIRNDSGNYLQIYTPIDFGATGLSKSGGSVRLYSPLTGSGTLTAAGGGLELSGNNSNFTGQIVVETGANLDLRAGFANSFGSTNQGTIINGTGQIRLRDLGAITVSEPVTINGVQNRGSLKSYASSDMTFNGPVTLNTNGVLAVESWANPVPSSEPGSKRRWFLNSAIADDGNNRGVHFITDVSQASGTGSLSRTSEIIFGGVGTYGGYTHITANRAPDGLSPFSGTVILTNGNDRLPTTTTLLLGGLTNTIGHVEGNGRLVLNGYNQELAGLVMLGTGISNRVTGGSSILSTLTLNVGAGTNNIFGGFLGGPGANDNNFALVSKGQGTLDLTAANTYGGTTTVTNGTLLVNGSHMGGGAYSIQNGGTLGGNGLIDAAVNVLSGASVAPGNSIGTLTVSNNLGLDGVLQIELDNAAGPGAGLSDLLIVNGVFDITGGTLQFSWSGTLTNDFYVFAEYETLSGGPFMDEGLLPDGYVLDYTFGDNSNQIALVIPEPAVLPLILAGAAAMIRWRRRRV